MAGRFCSLIFWPSCTAEHTYCINSNTYIRPLVFDRAARSVTHDWGQWERRASHFDSKFCGAELAALDSDFHFKNLYFWPFCCECNFWVRLQLWQIWFDFCAVSIGFCNHLCQRYRFIKPLICRLQIGILCFKLVFFNLPIDVSRLLSTDLLIETLEHSNEVQPRQCIMWYVRSGLMHYFWPWADRHVSVPGSAGWAASGIALRWRKFRRRTIRSFPCSSSPVLLRVNRPSKGRY